MDKLLKSPWFVRIISFLLALMLYFVVASEDNNLSSTIFPASDTEQMYQEVEVNANYNEDEYVLTGLPDKVNVRFEGTQAALSRFRLQRTPEVVIDLTSPEYKEGDYNIRLELNDLPNDIDVYFPEDNVKVTLHRKVTEEFDVQVEIINADKLPVGYVAGSPEYNNGKVSVTGVKELIDSIAYIRGFVDVSGAKENIIQEVDLKAYNEKMDELQLTINPNTIEVNVPITNPVRVVPIQVNTVGEIDEAFEVTKIATSVETVSVYGPQDVLDKLTTITLDVDLSKVTKDTEMVVTPDLPKGVLRMTPEEVKITIDITEKEDEDSANEDVVDTEETTTIENIPILVNGLADNLEVSFINPKDGNFNVVIKGNKEAVQKLNKDEISAMINLENLTEGRHTVKIEVSGPETLHIQQSIREALVTIEEQPTRS